VRIAPGHEPRAERTVELNRVDQQAARPRPLRFQRKEAERRRPARITSSPC
jgi:hypothetical protein